jgi:hypothetical protein
MKAVIKKIIPFIIFLIIILTIMGATPRQRFYNFDDQIIDGEIKKPTTLYTDAREKVKFERLLRLKKSFMDDLFDTAKERVFR